MNRIYRPNLRACSRSPQGRACRQPRTSQRRSFGGASSFWAKETAACGL